MPDLDSDITIAKINSKANNCITNIQNLEEIDFIHNNIKGKPIHRLTAKPAGLSKLPVIPYLLSKRTNCNHWDIPYKAWKVHTTTIIYDIVKTLKFKILLYKLLIEITIKYNTKTKIV